VPDIKLQGSDDNNLHRAGSVIIAKAKLSLSTTRRRVVGSRCIAPFLLNLSTELRQAVNFTP